MSPSLALLVYTLGIAGLFYLNRDSSIRTSMALWMPVIWLWIVSSRPASVWLGAAPSRTDLASQMLEGSPYDAAVFALLILTGIVVLVHRGRRVPVFLKASWPVLLYFAFCLVSVAWSDYPDVAFKRWIKSIGDLVMVLIILTDIDPVAALRKVFARIGFVLLPYSLLLIKYYDHLGRGYDIWEGQAMNTGVTDNKNSLGVITFIIAVGVLWRILMLLRDKSVPGRTRQLLAQGVLFLVGLRLLMLAHSATSSVCFAVGAVLMAVTQVHGSKPRPRTVHSLFFVLALTAGIAVLVGGMGTVTHAIGRKSNLTGRTEIWAAVIPMAENAAVGTGFESFWLGPRVKRLWIAFDGNPLNEAHNGYIEVYLNLGLIGVALMLLILVYGYRCSTALYAHQPAIGSIFLTYISTAAIYSITEAGFRMLFPMWMFFILGVVGAAGMKLAAQRRGQELLNPATRGTRDEQGVPPFPVPGYRRQGWLQQP